MRLSTNFLLASATAATAEAAASKAAEATATTATADESTAFLLHCNRHRSHHCAMHTIFQKQTLIESE